MSKCDHKHSRSFLGPMPKRVLDDYRKHDNLGTDEDNSNPASRLVMKHAFSFFIHEGGRTQDWNEQVQKQTRKKMMHRWRESGWGKVLVDTGDERETTDEWIGYSFEVGKFLGLDIINPSSQVVNNIVSGTQDQVSFSDTAPPEAGPSSRRANDLGKSALPSGTATVSAGASVRVTQHALEHALEHVTDIIPSDTHGQRNAANISVGATPLLDSTPPEDGVLRDRMLVRACYSETSLAALEFNEEYHRTARDIEYKAWGEYLVVLRKDRIELYEDYSFPVREWLSQYKRLAFVIPLSITRTQLSLYSFVDLSFCLTYTPRVPPDDRATSFWIPFVPRGSKVFIFKVKSRSRAYDWVWKLWLQFNGKLPRSIDVKSPALNATVTIDAPETCGNEAEKMYEIFNRENLIRLCTEGLSALSNWSAVIQREMAHGKRLELAWRLDANLDWIWLETDVNQEKRKWAVLCGLVAKESLKSTFLEIRLAEHCPNYIHLRNGDRVNEPSGVEGYLQQFRPYSLVKHRVYLSTHDGKLFVLSPQNAYPPSPPGLPHDLSPNLPDSKSARQTEIWRGALQIMHATGVCDLRNIVAIRRAFQLLSPHMHNEREAGDNSLDTCSFEEPTAEDNQDEGGGQGSIDLYTRRSFELLLKNGHVVRFEAYSSQLALNWINRLRSLVSYWKARHRFDARQEMELAQATRPPLTMPRREEDIHAPLKLPTPLPALVTMYTTSNWCIIEGCRPIVRSGILFTRKGLRGQYRLVHMSLVANHLVQYRIRTNSLLHPMVKKICLSDAYIFSGYLAALMLPEREFDPSKPPAGRRFQDGLETDDKDEDVIFMICYRSRSWPARDTLYHTNMTTDVPPLSSRQKTLVFRARSKLERDSWCWAINCEIERTVRIQQNRENAIRNNGNVIPSQTA